MACNYRDLVTIYVDMFNVAYMLRHMADIIHDHDVNLDSRSSLFIKAIEEHVTQQQRLARSLMDCIKECQKEVT